MSTINHSETTFKSRHGYSLFYQSWIMDSIEQKALLIIIHGYGEHGGRYNYLVDTFVPKGFRIFAMDLYGHGKSEGIRSYVDSFQNYFDDVEDFVYKIKNQEASSLPVFLYGHSMGSTITVHTAVQMQKSGFKATGIILSGIGTKIGGTNILFYYAAKIATHIIPRVHLKSPLDYNGISSDPKEVERYKQDPLICAAKGTPRMAAEFAKYALKQLKVANELTVPILILKGKDDKAMLKYEPLIAQIPPNAKTVYLYDGLRHELHNEKPESRKKVFTDIFTWMNQYL